MTRYEKIGDIIYPVTYLDGFVIVDYPEYNPALAKKIIKEGQKTLRKLSELMKKYKIKTTFNNTNE